MFLMFIWIRLAKFHFFPSKNGWQGNVWAFAKNSSVNDRALEKCWWFVKSGGLFKPLVTFPGEGRGGGGGERISPRNICFQELLRVRRRPNKRYVRPFQEDVVADVVSRWCTLRLTKRFQPFLSFAPRLNCLRTFYAKYVYLRKFAHRRRRWCTTNFWDCAVL